MKIIQFNKVYIPTVLVSLAIIISGIIGYFIEGGFNYGIDFRAGVNETVQLSYPAIDVTYAGKGNAVLTLDSEKATIVFSGAEVTGKTVEISFAENATMSALVAKLVAAGEGMSATLHEGEADLATTLLLPTFQGKTQLGATPLIINRRPANESEVFADAQKVRAALAPLGAVSVQSLKPENLQRYLIRVQDPGTSTSFIQTATAQIKASLETAFGKDRVVVMQTDYVGAAFSQVLGRQAWWLILLTLLVILAYTWFRFRFQYGFGAVLTVIHDMFIMVAFVIWTKMEFNASTIAAILTILGYSINDTIVQFDRVREERALNPNMPFVEVLNMALTKTLGRTFITTFATILSVLALLFFTKGTIHEFAKALLVGMISGVYSTIFIGGAFVLWYENTITPRRKVKPAAAPRIEEQV